MTDTNYNPNPLWHYLVVIVLTAAIAVASIFSTATPADITSDIGNAAIEYNTVGN